MRRMALAIIAAAVLTAPLSAQKTTNVHPGTFGPPSLRLGRLTPATVVEVLQGLQEMFGE